MGRPTKPVQAPICAHCGLPLDGEEFECVVPECADEKPKFHQACTVIREGVRICLDCNRNATDEASQAATQEID